jgi:hypothetical protein
MELTTAQQILVIFLSTALGLLLLLAIVIAVMAIRLLMTLRLIINKAEHLIESAEAVGNVFKKAATPMGVFHFLQGVVDMARRKHDNDKKE